MKKFLWALTPPFVSIFGGAPCFEISRFHQQNKKDKKKKDKRCFAYFSPCFGFVECLSKASIRTIKVSKFGGMLANKGLESDFHPGYPFQVIFSFQLMQNKVFPLEKDLGQKKLQNYRPCHGISLQYSFSWIHWIHF